jgi:hypothetical protein
MKMEAVYSSETLVFTYKSARRYYPEDQHRRFYHRDNLKSRIIIECYFIKELNHGNANLTDPVHKTTDSVNKQLFVCFIEVAE